MTIDPSADPPGPDSHEPLPPPLEQETGAQDNTLNVAEEPQESHRELEKPAKSPEMEDLEQTILRVKRRMTNISARLESKEYKQLGFVFEKYPIQYYRSWKGEGNHLFSLLVNYSTRLKALEEKLKKAESPSDQS